MVTFVCIIKLTSPPGLCENACTLGGVLFYRGYIMSENVFKTIDEQVSILISRGLLFDNEEKDKKFLLHNNYYRISGYSLTLRDHDTFFKHTRFQNIIDIYNFDYELRHILMKYLEIIEVKVKSTYAYYFSKIFGPDAYLNKSNFTDNEQYEKTISKINEQKEARLPHEPYLKHFVNDLHIDVPIWTMVDLMTIADISHLYSISLLQLQESVAMEFGFNMSNKVNIFKKLLKGMTIIRNLCAHGSRLFNRLFEQRPSLSRTERSLLITKTDKNGTQELDNSHLYGYIINMKRLLSASDFKSMKDEIQSLCSRISFVNMKYYGFRDDWESAL